MFLRETLNDTYRPSRLGRPAGESEIPDAAPAVRSDRRLSRPLVRDVSHSRIKVGDCRRGARRYTRATGVGARPALATYPPDHCAPGPSGASPYSQAPRCRMMNPPLSRISRRARSCPTTHYSPRFIKRLQKPGQSNTNTDSRYLCEPAGSFAVSFRA
jgi:hypothetical protein